MIIRPYPPEGGTPNRKMDGPGQNAAEDGADQERSDHRRRDRQEGKAAGKGAGERRRSVDVTR